MTTANRRVPAVAAMIWLSLAIAVSAGETWIYFVDAKYQAPLEFLKKTVKEKELGQTVHYNLPGNVVVDGKKRAFSSYSKRTSVLANDGDDGVAGMAELEEDLGTSGPKASAVKSDARSKVVGGTGVKALIGLGLADGRHTLHPGNIQFTVHDGEITKHPAFVKTGPSAWNLLCHPVDLNIYPDDRVDSTRVSISSGSHAVHQQFLYGETPQVVRVYLPASKTGYKVDVAGQGEFTIAVTADGAEAIGEPELKPGYALRCEGLAVGLVRLRKTPPAPALKATEPELYIFTDRCRQTFREGERVQFSVRAFGAAAAGTVEMTLTEDGKAMSLGKLSLDRFGKSSSAEVELDTTLLRPGEYVVQAQTDQTKSNPFPLVIAPTMPRTNMKIFGHTKWAGSDYSRKNLKILRDCGFNQLTHGVGGVRAGVMSPRETALRTLMKREIPTDANRFKAFQKANFPPELLEVPMRNQIAAESTLRHGIDLKPVRGGGLVLYFNVGKYWLDHADDALQSTQHLAQEWRRFPNFSGLVYGTGDGMTPATQGHVHAAPPASFDMAHKDRLKKLQEVFEARVGNIKVDTSANEAELEKIRAQMDGAMGFGIDMEDKSVVSGEDGIKLEWLRWLNTLYPDSHLRHRQALQQLVPGATMTVGNCSGGYYARNGMHPPLLYQHSDWVNNDHRGDTGALPFYLITQSDLFAMRRDRWPVRTRQPLDLVANSWVLYGYKNLLQALSRNPVGIGNYNFHSDTLAGSWSLQKRRSQALTRIADMATRFGDVYMELDRVDEIAVVSSFRQEGLAGQNYSLLIGAHYLTQKAGYQATMITEANCLKHPKELAKRYKGLFLVNMTRPLPAKFKEVLIAFRQQGGIILGDEASKDALPGLIIVPIHQLRASNHINHREIEDTFRPLAKQFRETVQPKLKPFFNTDGFDFGVIRSVDGDLEYWVAFNDARDTKTGDEDGVRAQFTYQGGRTAISAAKQGVLYDALRRQPVKVVKVDGGISFDSDMRYFPGTIYVLADRPVKALKLEHSKQVSRGRALQFKARALDAKQKSFTGRLPVEFTVSDPRGRVRYHLFRKTNEPILLKIAGNDLTGRWQIKAVEQVTGLTVESSFNVAGAAGKPGLRTVSDVVLDADTVHDLVTQKEVEIVIYPDQLAACEAIAVKLKKDLLARDIKVRRRLILPSLHRYYPMQWRYETVEDLEPREAVMDGEWVGHRVEGKNHVGHYLRGKMMEYAFYTAYARSAKTVYYKNVILLGRADGPGNPMLDLIIRSRMLPRNPSPSFPARGQGLVAHAWAPFHYGHNAVVVYGHDETGLRRAAQSLVQLVAGKRPARVYVPQPAIKGRENGQIYKAMGFQAATGMASALGSEQNAPSLMPAVYDRQIVDAVIAADGRVLIKQLMREDQGGPDLVAINPKTGAATQYVLDCDLEQFARMLAGERPLGRIPGKLHYYLDGDLVTALGGGIGRFSPEGKLRWFFDPARKPKLYKEAKFPRRCKVMTMSADRQWLLASIFDVTPTLGHGLTSLSPGYLVWLNTKTGKPAGLVSRYLANRLILAPDGSRALVLDDVCYGSTNHRDWYRPILNPHERFVLAAFDRQGRELSHFPIDHEQTDQLKTDRNLTLAVASFRDARRQVMLYDLNAGKSVAVGDDQADTGVAVAPDGSFAVIVYADGRVRLVNRTGDVIRETRVPAPGVPVVYADGTPAVAGHDGKLYRLDAKGAVAATIEFGSGPVQKPARSEDPVMPGLSEPHRPWWERLPKDVETAKVAGAPFTQAKTVTGEQTVTVRVPRMKPGDTLLLAVDYALQQSKDHLEVDLHLDGSKHVLIYPYLAQPRRIGIPLRPQQPGPVKLVFRAPGGVRLSRGQLIHLKLGLLGNAAYSPAEAGAQVANAAVARVYVYQVMGKLGNVRERDQLAYGFRVSGQAIKEGGVDPSTFPPGVTRKSKTNSNSYVDGDVYTGTPLYVSEYFSRDPKQKGLPAPNLRSAQIVIEYQKPRTIRGVGIWEHPGARPTSAFALEACDRYTVSEKCSRTLDGNWRLVTSGKNNHDYFHAHTFKPHKARVWRFTVIATPATIQRIAELELYQDAMDGLDIEGDLDDLDLEGDLDL